MVLLALVVLVGGALRFFNIGGQSLWFDEVTTLGLLKPSLWHTLSGVRGIEAEPPLYYILAWVWTRVFGDGTEAVRSFSALVGTAAIPCVWAAGREAASSRVGLAAAALVAVNPMLIWYSQEARAYSLLVLLAAASLWLFFRCLTNPSVGRLSAWAACCALALLTYYFAAFIIVAEASALLWLLRSQRRTVLAGLVPVALVGIALIPLIEAQDASARTAWIAARPVAGRLGAVLHELITANAGLILSGHAPRGPWAILAGAGVLAGAFAAVRLTDRRSRRTAGIALAMGASAIGIPLLITVTPLDRFLDRSLIAAWPLLAVSLAAGLAVARWQPVGAIALAAIAASGIAVTLQAASSVSLQRTDWRDAARALGPQAVTRAVIVEPGWEGQAFRHYRPGLVSFPPGVRIDELDVIATHVPRVPVPMGARISLAHRLQVQQLSVLRYRASAPFTFTAQELVRAKQPILLELSRAAFHWIQQYLSIAMQLKSYALSAHRSHRDATTLAELRVHIDALRRTAPAELPDTGILLNRLNALVSRRARSHGNLA